MKTFQLSKKDLEFLQPVDANIQALNMAVQVYIINVVYPRLSLEKTAQSRYDIGKGELYVNDEIKKEEVKKEPDGGANGQPAPKPDDKPVGGDNTPPGPAKGN